MTDYRLPFRHNAAPARKPVPGSSSGFPAPAYDPQQPRPQQPPPPPPQQLSPHPSATSLAHSRNRTSSSHVLPYMAQQQQYVGGGPSPLHTMTTPLQYPPSRRLSSATTSTNSTGNPAAPFSDIQRSASSRSAQGQLGYVALMRRQKATVWCDRSQPEDPRLRAQKVADKKRAYLEVHGAGAGRKGPLAGGKNKHGAKGAADFSASTLVGAKVPVRLSANEIGDAEDDARSDSGFPYRRTGSGRSSIGSAHRYPSGYQRPTPQGTMGSNSSPPNEKTDLPEVTEHPPAESHADDDKADTGSLRDDTGTLHSRGSERENSFGSVGDMAAPSAATAAAQKASKADELRRRGSVDDRTTSMTNVRLFVANPDLSD